LIGLNHEIRHLAFDMQKRFVARCEDVPGTEWLERFVAGRAEAETWYLSGGRAPLPTAEECATQLKRHMPELVRPYEHACALIGTDGLARQILSSYRPPPVAANAAAARSR
jgi:predicted choloylglycine hydrolase